MNIKKVFTFALAGALSISMLAGCGSSSNESTTSESKEDTSLTDVQSASLWDLTQTLHLWALQMITAKSLDLI